VRILIVLVVAAVIGVGASLALGNPFAKDSVTKTDIEHAVAKKVHGARVNLTLCNQVAVPSQTPQPKSRQTWTCDTYLGQSLATQRNGPSYDVVVDDGDIKSIRRVPPV
jgi:predicted secreted protein